MGDLKERTANTFKQRRLEFALVGLFVIVALPFLFKYGYCWGWWGRHSLLLQYYFQCQCPASSEQVRYPEEVDVIVSACTESWVALSPSGRLLYVQEKEPSNVAYILDLKSKERTDVSHQPYSTFLSDDLGFIRYPDPYIINRDTGMLYSIQKFKYMQSNATVNGDADLSKLAQALRDAQDVYFVNDSPYSVIALASDFDTRPEHSFFADSFDIPGYESNQMQRFLQENGALVHKSKNKCNPPVWEQGLGS